MFGIIFLRTENIFDTYNNKITKDLIMNGSVSYPYNAPKNVLSEISQKVNELKICELPNNIISDPDSNGITMSITPNNTFSIKFTIDGKEYFVSGDSTTDFVQTDEAKRLCAFRDYLKQIMYNTPEYKALPEASGAYQ